MTEPQVSDRKIEAVFQHAIAYLSLERPDLLPAENVSILLKTKVTAAKITDIDSSVPELALQVARAVLKSAVVPPWICTTGLAL